MENEKLNEVIKTYRKLSRTWMGDKKWEGLPKEFKPALRDYIKSFRDVSSLVFSLKAKDLPVIEHIEEEFLSDGLGAEMGALVKVKPCGDWAEGKTFLGFFIGDVPVSSGVKIEDGKIKSFLGMRNPLIFIPEVQKSVYGMESWWCAIKSEEDLKEISDEEINKIWYVEALKKIRDNE